MQARIYEYLSAFNEKLKEFLPEIIIFNDNKEVALGKDAAIYAGFECFCLPEFIAKRGDDLRSFSSELFKISEVLGAFYKSKNPKKLILSPFNTLLHTLPTKDHLQGITLKKKQKIINSCLKDELMLLGYNLVDIVQDKGEARISGEIIDIFSIDSQRPVRILLDFDEIESIKIFDEATQKASTDELDFAYIAPFLARLNQAEFEQVNSQINALSSDALIKDLHSFGFWYISGFKDYLSEFFFCFC